jgi:hypothetical protein
MPVKFDIKYNRSKSKIAKKIGVTKIVETEELFNIDPSHKKLNLKNITCRRDKQKQSIRVLGNDGFRILLTRKDETIYFQDIMNHNKYDRLTKDC